MAWTRVEGYPEAAYSVTGYPIDGSYSERAEITVFPVVNKYGISFTNGRKILKPDRLRVMVAACGKNYEGIVVKYELIASKKMDNITDCTDDLFASVQYNNTSTIYRFTQ